MKSFQPKDLSTAQLHGYLLASVSPRPIALASTVDANGNVNLSPFSFFNVFSANPPIMIFSPARRVRDNTTKHTLENALATKEVVINIVTYNMVQQTSLSSTEYAEGVNEFTKAGFTEIASDIIKPPRVAEAPVQFECKVNEIVSLGNEGGAGNLIICEVVKLHIHKSVLNDEDNIDQNNLDLVARAGGSYYSRAKTGFFEIPKPITTLGIGIDTIPKPIRNSAVLTGNNLGLLGNIEELPNKEAVDKFAKENPKYIGIDSTKKHIFAKEMLEINNVDSAWKILLIN
jgi:flavin reductase (DIM6/NTAB) family NADH-FMN oxidoreductase RutF